MKAAVVAETEPVGPPLSVVSGAFVSTVQERAASLASRLPAASTARTRKVCGPSATPVSWRGESQASQAASSSLHSKPAEASGESKVKVAFREAVDPDGPDWSAVSGATVSTVQVRDGLGRVGVAGGVGGAHAEGVRRPARAR